MHARLVAVALALLLTAPSASADDLLGLEDKSPRVVFDVPVTLLAHDVSPCNLSETWPEHRLIEIELPVSLRIASGDVTRVREVVIEVVASDPDALVHDFWPHTTLDTHGATAVEVTSTKDRGHTLEATLGGQLPIPGAEAAKVLPSITASKTGKDVVTETTTRLPPRHAVIVSGTLGGGRGVFYQLRPSPQATLEGQHLLSLQLLVPQSLSTTGLTITASASGQKRVLWMEQNEVWGTASQKLSVRYVTPEGVTHQVAKAVREEK